MTDDPLDDLDGTVDDDLLDGVREGDGESDDDTDGKSAGNRPDADDGRDWDETARSAGKTAGAGLGAALLFPPRVALKGLEGVVLGFTRVIPRAQGIWSRVIKAGYSGYYKTSGADIVGHVMKEGRLKHVPLTWNNDRHRFDGPDDTWWLAPGENEHTLLGPGNTPCAWAASKATNLGTQVQAETAEALDFGLGSEVHRDATIQFTTIEDAAAGAGGGNQAVADGGQAQTQYVSAANPGVLDDYVVPLSPLYETSDGSADGRLVSMEKYYETYPETVDSEEMKKQEDRGRLGEMDHAEKMKFALKVMALAALIIAIVQLGPQVVSALLGSGGGGGGGGGGMPFMFAGLGV